MVDKQKADMNRLLGCMSPTWFTQQSTHKSEYVKKCMTLAGVKLT